jgi:hypothetical protein
MTRGEAVLKEAMKAESFSVCIVGLYSFAPLIYSQTPQLSAYIHTILFDFILHLALRILCTIYLHHTQAFWQSAWVRKNTAYSPQS